jgi:probable phosphoglycerate mutase
MDSPLTGHGIQQAYQMGKKLAEEIYGFEDSFELQVSPLGRTKDTAARIVEIVPLTSRYEPGLQEISLGSWDGMTLYEIDQEYPGALQGVNAFNWFFRSPDGETFEQGVARATLWLASVTRPTIAI